MLNTVFSDENARIITDITHMLSTALGNAFYATPHSGLHITLLDWIAPLVDYDGADKAELFKSVYETYDVAMQASCRNIGSIQVRFDEVRVSPTTVFIVGKDNGQFQAIRDTFVASVDLLPGTKLPSTIVHCSLGRFRAELPIEFVESCAAECKIDIVQHVNWFRLINSHREPMLDFDEIKRYYL